MQLTTAHTRNQQGFTLIELMIVIAIVGILAAIAVPAYMTYTTKAKFSEVVHATAPFKLAVEVCAHAQGNLTNCGTPATNGIPANVTTPSTYVASIATGANGVITATSVPISGTAYTYILTPTSATGTGQVTWTTSGTCQAAGVC